MTTEDHTDPSAKDGAYPGFTTAIPVRPRPNVQNHYQAACAQAAEALTHAPGARQALERFFDALRDDLATRLLDAATDDATALILRRNAMALAQAASDLGLRPLDAAVQTGYLSRAARTPDGPRSSRPWDY